LAWPAFALTGAVTCSAGAVAQSAASVAAPQSDAASAPAPNAPADTFQPTIPHQPAAPAASSQLTLDDVQKKVLDRLTGLPRYFANTYRSALQAPLPSIVYHQGGIPKLVPMFETDRDATGRIGSYQPDGPVVTATNAFFQSLGTNGRSCATCHQPSSAMSVSVSNIQERFVISQGDDPIFAPVDGANCPNKVPANRTTGGPVGHLLGGNNTDLASAYSLLLNKGLFRIFIEVPSTI